MSVDFDKIGLGQSGRLVYQVMGKDGPIFNPENIKYLSPGEAQTSGFIPTIGGGDLVGLAAGLAGINLMVSFANLAVSAVIMKKVCEISEKLDAVHKISVDTLAQLKQMSHKLTTMDIKLSENNLRFALDHVGKRAVQGDSINLQEFKKLSSDINDFINSVDGYGYASHAQFRLSSDVSDKLKGLHGFLYGIRGTVARAHNLAAAGDPQKVLRMCPIDDYSPNFRYSSGCLRTPAFLHLANKDLEKHASHVATFVKNEFLFSGSKIYDDVYERVSSFSDTIWTRFNETDPYSLHLSNGLSKVLNSDAALKAPKILKMANDWENYWLVATDMGLIWRVRQELEGLGQYEKTFYGWWRQGEALGSDKLLIECNVG